MQRSALASILWFGLLVTAPSVMARIPGPPQPVLVDANSERFQKHLSREFGLARSEALRFNQPVIRRFVVGWEMHYGYYLAQENDARSQITPDLLDPHIIALLDAENGNDVLSKHVGEKLICECRGIEWTFYSDQRFIVQSAKLSWIR
jgi:hypothetical protein